MKTIRGIAAAILGLLAGGAVNMGLILAGSTIIPAPEGVDVTNAESIAAGMHLFGPQHFVTPFVAHAVGTLVGALTAHVIAASYRDQLAYFVGALSFAGGVAAARMIPAPVWFIAADLVLAYFPMALLAAKLGRKIKPA